MECTVTCPDGHERELRVTWHEPASRLAADARLSAATLRLLQESFGDDGFETEDDLYVAALRCLDADKCVWVTAEAGPDLVGVLAVSPYGGSVLVLNMCVAPAYRSIGLARFLLREGQKMAVRATPPLHRVSGHVRRDNARLLTMYAGFGALPSQDGIFSFQSSPPPVIHMVCSWEPSELPDVEAVTALQKREFSKRKTRYFPCLVVQLIIVACCLFLASRCRKKIKW
ncbi:hypothetical protein DIPPA_26913 [Diplonema papillatum]|nr:hypothetical protein DIPPA_26913 [Diplonema papillatum]